MDYLSNDKINITKYPLIKLMKQAKIGGNIMNKIQNTSNWSEQNQEETYRAIRGYVINAQRKVYAAVNFAMVNAYWEIGEQIFIACGENDRAGYGKQLLKYLSEKLTTEFGKGFDISNLRNMRKFYMTFQKRDALRPELSWTHYRSLMRVSDETTRDFYINEAVKAGWRSCENCN